MNGNQGMKKESERARQTLIKQTNELNYQLKKGVKLTLLAAGSIAALKYFGHNTENSINQETEAPITLEEVYNSYKEDIDAKVVDIDDLLEDYGDAITVDEINEINEKYNDEYIQVTGEINNIYVDSIDGDFITLKGNEQNVTNAMTVQCDFYNEEEVEQIKQLEKGDEVTIEGYCVGGKGMAIKINDCEIIK